MQNYKQVHTISTKDPRSQKENAIRSGSTTTASTKDSTAKRATAGDKPLGVGRREPAAPEPEGLQTGTAAMRLKITIKRRSEKTAAGEEGLEGSPIDHLG